MKNAQFSENRPNATTDVWGSWWLSKTLF